MSILKKLHVSKSNPIARVGNKFVKPNWRFDAMQNPARYQLQDFVRRPNAGSNCLRRYLSRGLSYEVNYVIPEDVRRYITQLSPENGKLLRHMWVRFFKRSKLKKIVVEPPQQFLLWNARMLANISDPFLRKALRHISSIEFDEAIAYAIDFSASPDTQEIFRFIGYCIYAKVSDEAIAIRWNIPVRYVEALRKLFFDFSAFPKDRIANFTYLRQLAINGTISDSDFAYYKRVYELGELGLRAQTDFYSLTDEERRLVEEYLGKSVISNTLNINFSIRTQKDAAAYGAVVSTLSSYYVKEAEIEHLRSRTRNIDAQTRRIEGQLVDASATLTDIDNQMLDYLRSLSLTEQPIEYKTLDDLK